jgi:hypothetical protein
MVLTAEEVRDLAILLRAVLDLAPESDDRRSASPASPKSIAVAIRVLSDAVRDRHAKDAMLANDLMTCAEELEWVVGKLTGQPVEAKRADDSPVKNFLDPQEALRHFQVAYASLFRVSGDASRSWVDWTSPPADISSLVDDVLRIFSPSQPSPGTSYLDRAVQARAALATATTVLHAPSN